MLLSPNDNAASWPWPWVDLWPVSTSRLEKWPALGLLGNLATAASCYFHRCKRSEDYERIATMVITISLTISCCTSLGHDTSKIAYRHRQGPLHELHFNLRGVSATQVFYFYTLTSLLRFSSVTTSCYTRWSIGQRKQSWCIVRRVQTTQVLVGFNGISSETTISEGR